MDLKEQAQEIGYAASDLELTVSTISNVAAQNDLKRAIGQLKAARTSVLNAVKKLEVRANG